MSKPNVPVFRPGVNYDSYFKKTVSQSGFNLRLIELLKDMMEQMKDEIYSDTFVCSNEDASSFSSIDDIVNWAKKQEKTPKGSDTIIVEVGPMAGAYIVKNKSLSSSSDIVKIPSSGGGGGGGTSEIYIKVGDTIVQPVSGVYDLTSNIETVVQNTPIVNEEGETITVSQIAQDVTEVKAVTERVEADLTEVHKKVETINTTIEENLALDEEQATAISKNTEVNEAQQEILDLFQVIS